MKGYLLDTNHLSEAILPVSHVRARVLQEHRRGWRVGTCIPVVCELEARIQNSRREPALRRNLRFLFQKAELWPLDLAVAHAYGTIYQDLRTRGRTLSKVDIMLAAMAQVMDLTILTTDQDFAALPHIRTENWIPPPP